MSFEVRQVDWDNHCDALYAVRHEVFVVGQNVPAEIEVDELDAVCVHLLATDAAGNPIGTARIDSEGHIGRVAVLQSWRGKGVGRALMLASIDCVRQKSLGVALLNSQLAAADFYEKLGFVRIGDEFVEAGIPHIEMRKLLKQ